MTSGRTTAAPEPTEVPVRGRGLVGVLSTVAALLGAALRFGALALVLFVMPVVGLVVSAVV